VSVNVERWQKTDPHSILPFQHSYGELEFTTDGTMINTLEGWKEVCTHILCPSVPDLQMPDH